MSELKSKEELGTTKQKSIFSFLQQQSNKKGTGGKSTLGQTTFNVATNIEIDEIDEITPSTSRMAIEQNGKFKLLTFIFLHLFSQKGSGERCLDYSTTLYSP